MTTPERLVDEEHLRLLRIAWLIAAAWNALWVSFPMIYIVMGLFFAFAVPHPAHGGDADARFVGCAFVSIGSAIALFMAVLAVLKFLTARAIGRRSSRILCVITAAIICLSIPYGTALGVATILVLTRPSVMELFAPAAP